MKTKSSLMGAICLALGLRAIGCGGHLNVGNDSRGGSSSSGAGPMAGTTSGNGGTAEATPADLPLASTPGRIRCDNAMCDSQSEYCCSGMGGSGGGGGFETCSTNFCPYRRECDETADCVGTEICCYSVVASPPAILAASCQQPEQCAFDGYWIGCGSQKDCTDAKAPACMAQECGGQTIQTCGPINRTACKTNNSGGSGGSGGGSSVIDYDLKQCGVGGDVVATTAESFPAQVAGQWLYCSGPSLFAAEYMGIELTSDGQWYFLDEISGQLVRRKDFTDQGTWKIVSTDTTTPPQISLDMAGGGGDGGLITFQQNPRAMRMSFMIGASNYVAVAP